MDSHTPTPDDLLAHATWLRPLAARLVGWDAADDVLQDTWSTALTRPPASRRALPNWLARVTRNAALQRRRSEKARVQREARSARSEALTGQTVLERAELHRTLVDEVMALDDPYRTALLLRGFEDRPPAEIAELTDPSPATVRSQLKRGHEKLRERLDRRWNGDRSAWMAALVPLCGPGPEAAVGSGLIGGFLMSLKSNYVLPFLFLALLGGGLAWWLADSSADAPPTDTVELDGIDESVADVSAEPQRAPGLFGRAVNAVATTKGGFVGRVADVVTGEPVAGAALVLSGADGMVLQGTTDERGRLDLQGVRAPASYDLKVTAPKLPERVLRGIAAASGSPTNLGTIWLGAPGRVEGIVRGSDGTVLAGAWVRAYPADAPGASLAKDFAAMLGSLDREPATLAATRTGADGRFALEGVPPGIATLTVGADGWQTKIVQAGVASGETGAPLAIRLQRGEGLTGIVVDEKGRPVDGARVAVAPQSMNTTEMLYGRQFAWSGRDGRFAFGALSDRDDLVVLAAAPGRPTTYLELGETPARDVRIVLRPESTLTATVVAPDGTTPLEGVSIVFVMGEDASVGLIQEDGTQERDSRPQGLFVGMTDEDGRARIPVTPGAIRMGMFTHDEYGVSMFVGQLAGQSMPGLMSGPGTASIGAGDVQMTFRYPAGVLVTGRVLDASGQPVVGARVQPVRLGSPDARPVAVDRNGAYRLRIQPGDGIRAMAPGYWQPADTRQPDVSGAGADGIQHDITLQPARTVAGRILLPGGKPAAGALVRLRVEEEGTFGVTKQQDLQTFARADGRYAFDGVAPGKPWRVLARLAGYVDGGTKPFDVRAEGVTSAPELMLKRGTTVEVIVRDSGRELLDGARVLLQDSAGMTTIWDVNEVLSGAEPT
ncbi:MAG: sigma-70 family RNA polymerase sigma factor, partial [Planctomycetota bacterium]|nr:sigma-70 family RNA polymerase sigma factor [Planctomycetota bacterium]